MTNRFWTRRQVEGSKRSLQNMNYIEEALKSEAHSFRIVWHRFWPGFDPHRRRLPIFVCNAEAERDLDE